MIVGVGINANTPSFPEELRPIATSLSAVLGREVELDELAAALLGELDALYAAWDAQTLDALEEYRARCLTPGREVSVEGRRGLARGIGEDYSLLVEWPDGTEEALRFGEVSVRGLYGYV